MGVNDHDILLMAEKFSPLEKKVLTYIVTRFCTSPVTDQTDEPEMSILHEMLSAGLHVSFIRDLCMDTDNIRRAGAVCRTLKAHGLFKD